MVRWRSEDRVSVHEVSVDDRGQLPVEGSVGPGEAGFDGAFGDSELLRIQLQQAQVELRNFFLLLSFEDEFESVGVFFTLQSDHVVVGSALQHLSQVVNAQSEGQRLVTSVSLEAFMS